MVTLYGIYNQPKGIRIKSDCQVAAWIKGNCPGVKFADYTGKGGTTCNWTRLQLDIKSTTLRHVPTVAYEDGKLRKQRFSDLDSSNVTEIINTLLVDWPELDYFAQHWPVKALAQGVINNKNYNDKQSGRLFDATDAQMARFNTLNSSGT
jgi:hypothetical protein